MRTKLIFVLAITLLLAWSFAFLILNYYLESIYEEIEERQVVSTKLSIEQVLSNKKNDLISKVRDWAVWDDAYDFVANKNKNFIKVNINNEILENYQVQGVVFTDIHHQVKYLISIDNNESEIKKNIESDQLQKEFIASSSIKDTYISIVKFKEIYYLLAVNKITPTSNPESAFNGYLYFYQKIDDAFLDNAGLASGASLSLVSIEGNPLREFKTKDSLFTYYPLQDFFGKTVVFLQGKVVREYDQFFKKLRMIVVFVSLIFAVLFFVIIYQVLNRIVLSPLRMIDQRTNDIANGQYRVNRIDYVVGEDEFANLARSINRMLDEKEKMQREIRHKTQLVGLGELASGIAHEINNPLTVMLLSLDKLKKRYADKIKEEPDVERIIAKIYNNTQRISKIVSGMKALSKNVDPSERSVVNVAKLIDETLELYQERLRDNDIQLSVRIEENKKSFIFANETQISQVLVNLLNNAIDAVVAKLERKVFVRLIQKEDRVCIEVGDNGYGIPDDLKDKVMQPFYTTKSSQKGTGLGLSISNEIIEHHDGKLVFNREILEGESFTVFSIRLNVQKDIFEA